MPPATEQQVRARAAELVGLAAQRGISRPAFALHGRFRGHLADDRDLLDMFEFQRDATAPADVAATPSRVFEALGFGLGACFQALPFQCVPESFGAVADNLPCSGSTP